MLNGSRLDSSELIHQGSGFTDDLPKLRVAFVEKCDYVDFKLSGKFSVFNDQGIAILEGVTAPLRWRLKIDNRQPAKYEYYILINKFYSKESAVEQEYLLIEKGIGVRIKTFGGKIYYKNKMINNNTEYWLVVDRLQSEEQALQFIEKRLAGMPVSVFRQKLSEPHALLGMYDNEFEKLAESENLLKIVPDTADVVCYLYDLTLHPAPDKIKKNYVILKGPVEFRCMDEGKVSIIGEYTIRDYISSVVAHHCYAEMPDEALKAMAICVRSQAIASLNLKHFDDPFDFCIGPHCQSVSGGLTIPPNVLHAVDNTGGMVLKKKNRIIETNYSYICGGITESNCQFDERTTDTNYQPVFDGSSNENVKKFGDLTQNQNLRKWIADTPEVFCNPDVYKNGQTPSYFKNYFRWKITYDREELEEYISIATGKKIGTLFDIIPLRRSSSGRIKEVEILASDHNVIIADKEGICKQLSQPALPSSCFIIEPQLDQEGFPESFTFLGVGLGHGRGLCLAGAVALAAQQLTYDEILKHYFRGCVIKKIYEGS